MSKLNDFWWEFTDRIYPRIRELSPKEKKDSDNRCQLELEIVKNRVNILPDTEEPLKYYLASITELLELEKDRKQSIEARLTSIIGLTSIANTIVFGGLVAQVTGTLHLVDCKCLKWLLIVGSAYLAIQLCVAILAALRGVSRSGYLTNKTTDMIPTDLDTIVFLKKRIISASEMHADHQNINSRP